MEKAEARLKKWEKYKGILTQKQFNWLNFGTSEDWSINEKGEVDVPGSFYCHGFRPLENIEQGYQDIRFGTIEKDFVASNIGLTSLEGSPRIVKGEFIASHNPIKSLKGCPEFVGGNLDISGCEINSIKGIGEVAKNLICYGNPLSTTIILSINKIMKEKKCTYELALVQCMEDTSIKMTDEERESIKKDLPEDIQLYKDILEYSLIK